MREHWSASPLPEAPRAPQASQDRAALAALRADVAELRRTVPRQARELTALRQRGSAAAEAVRSMLDLNDVCNRPKRRCKR